MIFNMLCTATHDRVRFGQRTGTCARTADSPPAVQPFSARLCCFCASYTSYVLNKDQITRYIHKSIMWYRTLRLAWAALLLLQGVQGWERWSKQGAGGPGGPGAPTAIKPEDILMAAVAKHQAGLHREAEAMYRQVLERDRHHPDALHLLGLLAHETGDSHNGVELIRRAIQESEKSKRPEPSYYSNLGELLRSLAAIDEAAVVLEEGLKRFPNFTSMAYNLAAVREEQGLPEQQEALLESVMEQQPQNVEAMLRLATAAYKRAHVERSQYWYVKAAQLASGGEERKRALTGLGLCHFQLGHVPQALEVFEQILRHYPEDDNARLNVGAMLQADGRFDEALVVYDEWLVRRPDTVAALNNKAAILLNSGREEQAAPLFERALSLDPNCTECLINLASYYQEEGLLDSARRHYSRAYELTGNVGLLIRDALMLAPVLPTNTPIAQVRRDLESRVRRLLSGLPVNAGQGSDPASSVERIHFYMVYHGDHAHDHVMQALISQVYLTVWPQLLTVAPHCHPHLPLPPPPAAVAVGQGAIQPIKVGFISRFFGLKEPHGLLLEGIMRHLPRTRFHVVGLVVPSPNKPPSPEVESGVDELHTLSLHYPTARQQVAALQLDVLIFGEMNSEPVNHFLGMGRLAPVQVLFWGNPVTSGSPSIDYFVSADVMEDPHGRTRMHPSQEPYSEQVVLLDGQGIWYRRPSLPQTWEPRVAYGLQPQWHVYMCAQSVFKMHPVMDHVFARILREDPQGHLVFLEGRRPQWTTVFQQRLTAAGVDMSRVHFMARVNAGEKYLQLLHVADVILHPFPFGGSRTSAEALYLGKAIVVLKNQSLRGRMAESLLWSMGLQHYVAADVDAYVALALSLGRDVERREEMEADIRLNVDKLWDRRDVVYEWARFLARAVGQPPVSPLEVGYPSLAAYEADIAHYPPLHQQPPSPTPPSPPQGESRSREQQEVVERLLDFAARLYRQGQADAALELWAQAMQIDDTDPRLLNDMGAALQEQWRLEEAENVLRRAVQFSPPGYSLALNNLAVTLHAQGKRQEAIHYYTRSLEGKTWRDEGVDLFVNNLGNLLRDEGRMLDAVHLYIRHLELPPAGQGGGLVALLALHKLGPRHQAPIHRLQAALVKQGRLLLPPGESLLSLVERLQSGQHYLTANSLVIFLTYLQQLEPPLMDFYEAFSTPEPPQLMAAEVLQHSATLGSSVLPPLSSLDGVHVLVGYFSHASSSRQWEVDLCLALNAANPYVEKVHLLLEGDAQAAAALEARAAAVVGPAFASKLVGVSMGHRPTFSDALGYANTHLSGQVVVLLNADIFLDHSIARLWPPRAVDLDHRVLSLLRWEVRGLNVTGAEVALSSLSSTASSGQGPLAQSRLIRAFHNAMGGEGSFYHSMLHPRIDSQDGWIFRAPLPQSVVDDASFEIGRPRCDNRLAHIFESHGFEVESPSMALRLHHVHQKHHPPGTGAEKREGGAGVGGYGGEGQVNGQLSSVLLSDQWTF